MVVSEAHRFLHSRAFDKEPQRTWVLYGHIYDYFYHDLLYGCLSLRRTLELWALNQGVQWTVTLQRDGTLDLSGNRDPQAARELLTRVCSRPPKYSNAPSQLTPPTPTLDSSAQPGSAQAVEAQAQQTAQAAQQAAGGRGQSLLNTVAQLSQLLNSSSALSLVILEDFADLVGRLRNNAQTQAVADELLDTARQWVTRNARLTNLLVFTATDERAMRELLNGVDELVRWQEIGAPEPAEIQAAIERALCRHEVSASDLTEIAKRLSGYGYLQLALAPVSRAIASGRNLNLKDVLDLPPPRPTEIERIRQELNGLVGLKEVKEKFESIVSKATDLHDRLERGERLPEETMHLVFLGNPGTGKTTVARLFARLFHAVGLLPRPEVVEISAATVMSSTVGETRERMQRKLEEARGGVLFIDEAHQFGDPESFQAKEAIQALVPAAWNWRTELIIILAGYANRMPDLFKMDEGLARRFPKHGWIEFADYSEEELWQILERKFAQLGFTLAEEAKPRLRLLLRRRVRRGGFGNAGGVDNLVNEILEQHRRNSSAFPSGQVITAKDLPPLIQRHPECLERAWKELDKLVGMTEVRRHIETLVAAMQYDLEEEEQGRGTGEVKLHPGNLLFVGPPGTGKTTIGRLIAELLYGIGCLERPVCTYATRGDLVAEYQGQTALKTRALVERARGGVLFIDEAYSLTADRGDTFGREALGELIAQITSPDNAGTVFILAGYPDEVEALLDLNPGLRSRFPVRLEFQPFTPDDCAELVRRRFEQDRFTWEEGALERVRQLAEVAKQRESRAFGNARWADSLAERAIQRMKIRAVKLPPEHPDRRKVKLEDLGEER